MKKESIFLTAEDVELIIKSFQEIGIEPTVDIDAIKDAFRKKVLTCHPDKATTDAEGKRFHNQFIKLTEARDICFRAASIADLLDQLSSDSQPESSADVHFNSSTEKDGYESEWKVFVDDADAYSNLFKSSQNAILSVALMTVFSLLFSIASMIAIGVITTFIVSAVSASVAIPIAGWIFGIIFLYGLFKGLRGLYSMSCEFIKGALSKTGFPYRFYVLGWVTANFVVLSLYASFAKQIDFIFGGISLIGIPIMLYLSKVAYSILDEYQTQYDYEDSWFSIGAAIVISFVFFLVYGIVLGFQDEQSFASFIFLILLYCINAGYNVLFIGVSEELAEIQKQLDSIRARVSNRALVLVSQKPRF